MGAYYHYKNGSRKPRKFRLAVSVLLVVLIVGCTYFFYPKQETTANINQPNSFNITKQDPQKEALDAPIPWPSYGNSAFSVKEGDKIVAAQSSEKPAPIASLTKVITALAVLEKKPLKPGEKGPMITIDKQDAALYGKYLSKNGAVLPLQEGQQISQHDAIQAMLMVSANNVSDILVRWAFGSMEEYLDYANNMTQELGLRKTIVADASGFSPRTVSTAEEMTQLGHLYIENPVLKEITQRTGATIPGIGEIQNYNSVLEEFEITGIKVGDTDEAGRCFIAADISGENTSIAVVLGAENFIEAIKDTQKILKTGNSAYKKSNL